MKQLLQGRNKTAKRDIVQFVPFKDFINKPEELAAEVIQELPEQVTGFYRSINRKPSKPPTPGKMPSSLNYPEPPSF